MSFNRGTRLFTTHKTLSQKYNEEFDFDWNDYRTIKTNENKFSVITAFLEKPSTVAEALRSDEKYDLASLCYKVGAFYNHIKRNPDLALPQLEMAEHVLAKEANAWTRIQIAFCFQQKYAKTHSKEFAIEALHGCNLVEKNYLSSDEPRHIKLVAFAYCVRALTEYEMKNINEALASYRFALDLYEQLDEHDDQYARAKNRWAMMLVDNNRIKEARQAFAELENYWSKDNDPYNTYRARADITHGEFLLKYDANSQLALDKFKKAHATLLLIEGEESRFTQDIQKKILELEEKIQQENKSSYSPKMYAVNTRATISAEPTEEIKKERRLSH